MAGPTLPAKKGGMIKWVIIGVIAFLVLCCCGAFALSQGDDGTDTSSSESTSSSQTESSSANESEEPAAKPAEKKTAAKSPSSTKVPAPVSPAGADMKVTAGEFIKEFEGNELAADQKYKGKTVEVSGVVEKIDTDGGDFEFLSVTCAQGLTGKKVEVYSLPHSRIDMWSSENAGGMFDFNSELGMWTRAGHIKIKLDKKDRRAPAGSAHRVGSYCQAASSRTRSPPAVLMNRGVRETVSPAMTAFGRRRARQCFAVAYAPLARVGPYRSPRP